MYKMNFNFPDFYQKVVLEIFQEEKMLNHKMVNPSIQKIAKEGLC